MRKDVSRGPYGMYFGRINGVDITGNNLEMQTKFASEGTRYNSLNHLQGDQSDYFGNDNDYNFFLAPKMDALPQVMDQVEFFNSHLDLNYDLPSTTNVGRFNAQTGGRRR